MSKKQLPLDPRQESFLAFYFDPKSSSFSEIRASAIRAGFSESYAENITALAPDWLSDAIGNHKLLSKAERNLDEFLDMDTVEPLIQNGTMVIDEAGNMIKRNNPQLVKEKKETTFFVAERLGKKKYAERHENVNVNIPVPLLGGDSIKNENNGNRKTIEPQKED